MPTMPSDWINARQSPEERREKYWLCRSAGVNSYWAIRMRDWSIKQIERKLGYFRQNRLQLMPDGRVQVNSADVVKP